METIELMSCMGCGHIIDQLNMIPRCNCGGRYFKAVGPTKMVLLRWFLGNPKQVTKLIIQDIKEHLYGK